VAGDWQFNNPAKALKPPKVKPKPTLPFEDSEVERLTEACDIWCERWGGDAREPRALFLTLRHSGLRSSDAVSPKRTRLEEDKIFLYQQKTGEPVLVPIPPTVVDALNSMDSSGEDFLWSGRGNLKSALEAWRRTLLTIAEIAQVRNARFHRFRDTFAVDLLLKDVPIEPSQFCSATHPSRSQKSRS
jgi:integrase